jgi:ferric-dicitrate binding protein FerR (iron transport regulator)
MFPSEKDKQYFFELLSKYNNGTATAAETVFVERLLTIMNYRRNDALTDFEAQKSAIEKSIETRLFNSIQQEAEAPVFQPVVHRVHFLRRYSRWAAAAVFILVLSAGTYYLFNRPARLPATTGIAAEKNDVAPGGDKAVLTLANGSTITLDSAHNGALAQQGNATVVKKNNGQLAYNTQNEKPTEVLYNTLTTPRGGQYQLVLPDGSKVWLNAASSIRYPTAFAGKERKIEITGEAYFEVAKNTGIPFIVKTNGMEVKVLGTHFNVNAYDDEAVIKTTLLEGVVEVTKDAATALLKPGQQSQLTKLGKINVMDNADVEEAVAWKEGNFYFKDADIQAIMRQVARWYDVEIVYEGRIPEGHFVGRPSRSLTAAQMLKIVEYSGVKIRIEGKKIIVNE